MTVLVCVGSAFPGGIDAEILFPFEDSELFDYYEVGPDGQLSMTAQTRRCLCSDLIEPVIRRGISAVIVKDLSSPSLFKFTGGGVRVYLSSERSVRESLRLFREGKLEELTMRDMPRLSRKRREGV